MRDDQFCLDMTRGVICRNVNRTCLCTLVQLPTQNWIKLDFNFDSRNVILVRLLQTVIAVTRFFLKDIYLLNGR
jgi:hypothetical protein